MIGGIEQLVKVAHFRLSYSRQMFVIAYPRETQEMVLDAHNQAFSFFGGVPKRMVYDNLKTVVDAIFVGKERRFNRRFLTLANPTLFEPVACTPESGWEKGQVENLVGNSREWLFTPLPHCADFAELNAWLARRCLELAGRPHPEQTSRCSADCFAEEQPLLMPIKAVFDGYVESMRRVSSLCLIRIDRNRYSLPAQWANRVVSVRVLGQLDYALVRWVKRKYRRLKRARKKRGHGLKVWPGVSSSFLLIGKLYQSQQVFILIA